MVTQSPAIDAFLTEIKRVTGHDIRWNPIPSNRVYAPLAEWVIDELDERHGLSHPIVGQPPPAAETLG